MPGTPALTALRARIEASGLALVLAQLVPMMINPSGVPHALALCLAPEIAALAAGLETALAEQTSTGQGLLRLPGDEQGGGEAFMRAWTGHLHQLAGRARAQRAADVGAGDETAGGACDADVAAGGRPQDAGPTLEPDAQPDEEGITSR
ncbi:hypothetical protein [Streptomyces coeruleorubidus]|uniref:hypothetical protein n=1 Tax=Streptomyces coeruleorubidus TaxID=116188 RepID=UPI0033DC9661